MIGRNWTIIFTAYGYRVQLYDINQELLSKAKELIKTDLTELVKSKSARTESSVEDRLALISTTDSLRECVSSAIHIQECVFENVEMKQKIFKEIDELLEVDNKSTTLASSTSFCMPSVLFKDVVKHIDQCIVAHPINPPLFVRLVELVCHPKTNQEVVERTRQLMSTVGQKPVVLRKEVNGFALNILQSAILHQAFGMIQDGIINAEDLDVVMTEGLAPRYAFIGPWMTAHLNANGLGDYFDRYGKSLYAVTSERPLVPMEGETASIIARELERQVPLDKLPEKRAWRDSCLKDLDTIKKQIE